ncbi:riboflavin synthase [Aliivibrio logei]|uniref:riboflavin synthase n=1 Tax=Aliivibrio logei TaxID=688 RepID=UPI0035C90AE0
MFKGNVQGVGTVENIDKGAKFQSLHGVSLLPIDADLQSHDIIFPKDILEGVTSGELIAINGVRLTVVHTDKSIVRFDINDALELTTLGQLKVGDKVNIEKSFKFGDMTGGRSLSGIVTGVADIVEFIEKENNRQIWIEAPEHLTEFLVEKKYIGVDGVYLVIDAIENNRFCINLLLETDMRWYKKGSKVNIEIPDIAGNW